MRIAIACTMALGLWMCGSDEEVEVIAPVPPAADPPVQVQVVAPPPAHGGTVVMAGPRPVEVVAAPNGNVQAYLLSPNPPQNASLTVRVPDPQGSLHPVVLIWDPTAGYFRGRLRGATLAPGPIEVVLVEGGQTYEAEAPTYVILAPPPPVVVERAPQQVQVVRRGGPDVVYVEEEPGPVYIEQPGPPVFVVGPPPPPVFVAPPRPSVVVVGPPGQVRHHGNDGVVVVNPGHGHGHGHGNGHWH